MPREDMLFEHFGRHNTKHGPTRFPLARFVSLLDVETCTIMGYRFGPHTTSEIEMAKELIELLSPGDLTLLDRGLTGSPSMARIRARGAEFLGRKNARLDPDKVRRMTLVGSTRMAVFDELAEHSLALYDKGIDLMPVESERKDYDDFDDVQLVHRVGNVEHPVFDRPEPLALLAEDFIRCVGTGETPVAGPNHGRDVVAVLSGETPRYPVNDLG